MKSLIERLHDQMHDWYHKNSQYDALQTEDERAAFRTVMIDNLSISGLLMHLDNSFEQEKREKQGQVTRLLTSIEVNFRKRLEAKTNWGRNDLMVEYSHSVTQALAEALDENQDR